jgi:hypothetical protein
MRLRTWSFFLVLFLIFQTQSFAQEEEPDDEPPFIDSEWGDYETTLYSKGDKTFSMTLGFVFPMYFTRDDPNADNKIGLGMGGTGTLAFNYFFSPNFFFCGELSGMFMGTRGKNTLFMIPFGVRFGYQFVFRRFEFPLSLMVGGAQQMLLEKRYFGPIIKPGASVFWRFNPDWSFGLNAIWWVVPQWKTQDKHDVIGNFLGLTLSARYHF